MFVDSFAYENNISRIHPGEKLALAIGSMMIGFLGDSMTCITIAATFIFILVFVAQIPLKAYLRVAFFPFAFAAVSIFTAALSLFPGKEAVVVFSLGSLKFGILPSEIPFMMETFLRVVALMTCSLFLAFTTPILDLLYIMEKLKVPKTLRELLLLFYKYIFILENSIEQIYNAQDCRLGYSSFKRSIYSLSSLIVSIFIKSLRDSEKFYTGLVSRSYDGDIPSYGEDYVLTRKGIISVFVIHTVFFLILIRRSILWKIF